MVIFIIKKIKQSKIKNQILIQAIFLNFAFTDIFFCNKKHRLPDKSSQKRDNEKKKFLSG